MHNNRPLDSASVQRPAALPAWLLTALRLRFGPTDGAGLGERVGERYAALLAQPSPFVDPRERAFASAEILPLLALYQTLRADGYSAEAADTDVRRLRAQALREHRVPGMWLTAHAPGHRYWLRRLVQHKVEAAFPAPSFKLVTTRSEGGTLEFEVERCPYRTALAAYGAPELLATFCRLDEVRFDVLAQAVTCEHTMSPGVCRFSFHPEPNKEALEEAEAYLEF